MLRRKRGGGKAPKKMAKKAVPTALQADVTNDEEWTKILEKEGLIVVDVYSEWSGPCTGMVSILKKIKMELGGDVLSYAIAKCENITDLKRFEGKSEPTWMFIRNTRMVNLIFGANCPKLINTLTKELQRLQNDEPHEFSFPVSEMSPKEVERLRILEEARKAKETAKRIQKETEAKERYESEMNHLISSLSNETCLLIYPWVFKDQEGHRRDKKSSPPYVELVEEILSGNYIIEQEIRKRLNDSILERLLDESDCVFDDENKRLLFDGKCMFMRLKINEKRPDVDVHDYLIKLLFEQATFPIREEPLVEGCFAQRHKPAFLSLEAEDNQIYPIVWIPVNPRNKAIIFRTTFGSYISTTYPYEDKSSRVPIILFKYDSTRKNELKIILKSLEDEVINFGIFEYDKPPEAKLIASTIEEYESSAAERTGYEIFVCTVKKVGSEAFLSFAGIGPSHVSENPEKAFEESKLYFPDAISVEDTQSDDEDKIPDGSRIDENEANSNSVI
ncbi:thioredoxin domain-containing protein 3-like isoform X4 [Prorops nasuta]|uniref:thioredoxin domain-containing protein 3-like isoform X4 n=1 Tax=Prorops nasuta TaxID=863751 RepID=UPI0034CDC6B1